MEGAGTDGVHALVTQGLDHAGSHARCDVVVAELAVLGAPPRVHKAIVRQCDAVVKAKADAENLNTLQRAHGGGLALGLDVLGVAEAAIFITLAEREHLAGLCDTEKSWGEQAGTEHGSAWASSTLLQCRAGSTKMWRASLRAEDTGDRENDGKTRTRHDGGVVQPTRHGGDGGVVKESNLSAVRRGLQGPDAKLAKAALAP